MASKCESFWWQAAKHWAALLATLGSSVELCGALLEVD
jgi:hypothetical protein